jgi:transketolase
MVMDIESVAAKWSAFGWSVEEVNGNDMAEIVAAFAALRGKPGPKAIILRTTPGWGVPTIVARDRAHFVRVHEDEWTKLLAELEENHG